MSGVQNFKKNVLNTFLFFFILIQKNMKLFFLSVLICCVSMFAKGQDSTALQFSKGITQTTLATHLNTLSSDVYEGRGTGTLGQKKAAYYIKSRFEEIGLSPVFPEDTAQYYQYFKISKSFNYDVLNNLIKPFGRKKLNADDFYFAPNFKMYSDEIEIVWVGNEIDSSTYIKGRIVMVLLADNDSYSDMNKIDEQTEIAKKNGAAGIFFAHSTYLSFDLFKARTKAFSGMFQKAKAPTSTISTFGVVHLNPNAASKLLGITTIKKFEKFIQNDANNFLSIKAMVKLGQEVSTNLTENVIGVLPGTTKKDEYVFVIAHYDHLGVSENVIYNGADDNGSGTTTLLNIANAYAKAAEAGFPPERNIVFVAFAGEELGLLGSNYFTLNLLIPHNSIHAVFNVDMIGRGEFNRKSQKLNLYIVGEKSETERNETIVNTYFPMINLDYEYNSKNHSERLYYRSDHYNFAKYGIPFIYFTTGLHNDYHKPTDDSDKINYETLTLIAQLMFLNVWQAANE